MENQIRGTITGQALTLEHDLIVAGTNEYITGKFQFSPDWNGLSIWAHFDRGNSHWKIHLHDGEILRSDKLNLTQGVWEVSLHGTAVDGMRITTEPVDLSVRRTNIDGDEPLGGAPASPLEQLDQRVTALEAGGGAGGGGGTTDHSKLTNRNQPDQHPMEAITGLVELRDKINTFFNADDPTLDQLAELINAIKANQGTIEQLTNGKVNVSDIVNDLTTGGAGKVLSAEMGVELKRLIDAVPDWAMSPTKPTYNAQEIGALSQSELQSGIDKALTQAKQSGEFDGKDGTDGKPGRDGIDGKPGKDGTNGKDGGHYTPSVSQPDPVHLQIGFTGSHPGMPPIDPVTVELPKGEGGSGDGVSPEDRKKWDAGAEELAVGDAPDTDSTKAHLADGGEVQIPETAEDIKATVPAGLPPETPETAQGVLNALAARKPDGQPGGGGSKLTLKKTIEVQDGVTNVQEDFTALGIEYPVIYVETPKTVSDFGVGLWGANGRWAYLMYKAKLTEVLHIMIELSECPIPGYKILTYTTSERWNISYGWPAKGTYAQQLTQQFGGVWPAKQIRLRGGGNLGGAKIYIMARE